MIKNRDVLEDAIERYFNMINPKSEEYKAIQGNMLKYNYLPGAVNSVARQSRPISDLKENELYWFLESIFKASNKNDLNPRDWFSSHEIQMHSGDTVVTEQVKYPIVFENVLKLTDDQWLCVVNEAFIKKLYGWQIINYNKNTQRQMKKRVANGQQSYQITLSRQKVNQITTAMLSNLYIPDELTLNISENNPDNDFEYKDGTIILKSGQMDIIDGYHRYYSIVDALLKNPEFKINMQIKICSFSEEKARRFIVQKDKQTPMKRSIISSYDVNEAARVLASRINEKSDCVLFGKMYSYNKDNVDYFAFINALGAYSDQYKSRMRLIEITNGISELFNEYSEKRDDFSYYPMCVLVIGYFKNLKMSEILKFIDYFKAQNKTIKINRAIKMIDRMLEGENL